MQDLGFLSFTLPEVEILMPTKTPRGQEPPQQQRCLSSPVRAPPRLAGLQAAPAGPAAGAGGVA